MFESQKMEKDNGNDRINNLSKVDSKEKIGKFIMRLRYREFNYKSLQMYKFLPWKLNKEYRCFKPKLSWKIS